MAEESMYDHTYQWGSKRTGPDIARLGGKYSDEWHRKHLKYPRDVVPESVMPNCFFLENAKVDTVKTVKTMEVMTKMPFNPVPKAIYSTEYIAAAPEALKDKTEMDAVIAFLQSLGNHVKFEEGVNYRDFTVLAFVAMIAVYIMVFNPRNKDAFAAQADMALRDEGDENNSGDKK